MFQFLFRVVCLHMWLMVVSYSVLALIPACFTLYKCHWHGTPVSNVLVSKFFQISSVPISIKVPKVGERCHPYVWRYQLEGFCSCNIQLHCQ